MLAAATLITTCAIILAVFYPFLTHGEVSPAVRTANVTNSSLEDQRQRCVQVLKDLELDFATGKVDPLDYKQMKASLSLELSELLDLIESVD